ncbi:MAG TPA: LptF/LptG family permease [Devosiaceae bacterium]|jgi:lipopolysaccharide export system permease protein
MSRLTVYLVRLFSSNAIAFAVVASVLIWLIQCLRIFDVVSVKGQGILTLLGQAVLTMPPLLIVFLYVCWGIGLGRALRDLQASQELHSIHSSRRLRALFEAVAVFTALGAVILLLLSNFVDPIATRKLNDWSASIAADLVSRTLRPHRFAEVVPGVVMVIGNRSGLGEITDFFADDKRDPAVRRTYVARSATVSSDENGYVLNLRDGYLQYLSDGNEFSQVSFASYNLGLERLTQPADDRNGLKESNSLELIREALTTGIWDKQAVSLLATRAAEGLRIVGMSILVAGLAGFPSGRRRRRGLPLELTVLVAAFGERLVTAYTPGPIAPFAGALVMLAIGILLLLYKLQLHVSLFRPAGGRGEQTA